MQIIKMEQSRVGQPEYKRVLIIEDDAVGGDSVELTGVDVGLGEEDILDIGSIIMYNNMTMIAFQEGLFRKKV